MYTYGDPNSRKIHEEVTFPWNPQIKKGCERYGVN